MPEQTGEARNLSDNPEKAGASYSAPALEKGLDVIEYLAEQDGGRSLVEISRRVRPLA